MRVKNNKLRLNNETWATALFSSSFEIWTITLPSPAWLQFQFSRRSINLILLQHVFDLLGGRLVVQMFGRIPAGTEEPLQLSKQSHNQMSVQQRLKLMMEI